MKKIDRLLLKILAASAVIYTISVIFSNDKKNAEKPVESAILNPKYKNEVREIQIQKNSGGETEEITLKKRGDFWLLEKDFPEAEEAAKSPGEKITAISDGKIIESLIEKSTKIRKMYKISDNDKNYRSFGLSDGSAISVSFLKNDGSLYTKIDFGYADSLTNRIYLRSLISETVYATENEFSQYLTTDSNYWSEGEFFPEIKNTVKISLELKKTESQKSLKESALDEKIRSSMLKSVIEENPSETAQKIVLDEKSPDFAEKSRKLLSLRHGKVRPQSALDSSFLIATLTVEDGSGRISVVDVFEVSGEVEPAAGENSYFYRKRIVPSPADSNETAFALLAEDAVYEISGWTWGRLQIF